MARWLASLLLASSAVLTVAAQSGTPPQNTQPAQTPGGFKQRENPPVGPLTIAPGTRILLNMINSVSTKHAQPGDRIYLETAFPVTSGDRIVIPQGSWVTGTITEVKRPGRVKGRGQLEVRFDSLTLPNGVNRNFRSDLGAIDPRDDETLKREQNKISGPGGKGHDAEIVVTGASAGTLAGAIASGTAGGMGIGAAAGAAAGLVGVLLTRGPDAMLRKGSTVEMVLDRSLTFDGSELDFSNAPPRTPLSEGASRTPPQQQHRPRWIPGIPW